MSEEETSDTNGTTIRILIKEGDEYKIHQACKKQLVYFDNVYVKNELYFYDNDFKIYEAETFKLRNGTFPYGNEMHVVLGQVCYPIAWNTLGIETLNLPVGIKFDIGELEVTLSREELNYTDEVKQLIFERINLVKDILLEKYENQINITDLFEYANLVHNRRKPPLKIEEVEIPMTNIKTSIKFKPLDSIKISHKNIQDLFSCYSIRFFSSGKISEHSSNLNLIYRNNYDARLLHGRVNFWDTKYLNSGYLVKREKLTRSRYLKLAMLLKMVENANEISFDSWRHSNKPIYKPGTIKVVYELIKYVDDYLKANLKKYDGAAPDWYIEEEKAKQKEYAEGRKDLITYYDIHNKRSQLKLGEMLDKYKIIFYADKSDFKETLLGYNYLYSLGNDYFKKNTLFIIVSTSVIPKFNKHKSMHHISNIVKVKSYRNLLHRLYLSKKIREDVTMKRTNFKYSSYYTNIYDKLRSTYTEKYETEYRNIPVSKDHATSYTIDLCKIFSKEIANTVLTKNRKTLIYEENIDELLKASKKLVICQFIKDDIPHDRLVELLSFYRVLKLDEKYYNRNFNPNN